MSPKKDLTGRVSKERLVHNLKKTVSIPSVTGSESQLTDFLARELDQLGVEPNYQRVEGERNNVYALHYFEEPGPLVSLNAHTDTVPPGSGWATDPFEPVEEDGKIYGLGALDMKGGLVALLEAFRIIVRSEVNLPGGVAFTAVVDEEAYSKGAKKLLSSEISDSAAVISGEPFWGSEEKPVPLGITGKILYEVTARGKSAHGAEPERGVNAIEDMARVLGNLDDLQLGKGSQFGAGNICTLKIEGGYEKYSVTVPENSKAIINRLIVPGQSIKSAVREMEEFIEKLSLDSDFQVSSKSPSYNPFTLSDSEPIMRAFSDSYEDVVGTGPTFGYIRNIMDANIFVNRAGIPTLVFGPRGGRMHAPDEFVEIESLVRTTKIYLRTIIDYLRTPGNEA